MVTYGITIISMGKFLGHFTKTFLNATFMVKSREEYLEKRASPYRNKNEFICRKFSFFPFIHAYSLQTRLFVLCVWLNLFQNLKLNEINVSLLRKMHKNHGFSKSVAVLDQQCPLLKFLWLLSLDKARCIWKQTYNTVADG